MSISYQKAIEILNGRDKRKIDNNTYLSRVDDVFVVRLHSTDIIKIYPDNTQVLFNGGYLTATTKNRISEYSFANVHQKNHAWYLHDGTEFESGMRVNSYGEVIV